MKRAYCDASYPSTLLNFPFTHTTSYISCLCCKMSLDSDASTGARGDCSWLAPAQQSIDDVGRRHGLSMFVTLQVSIVTGFRDMFDVRCSMLFGVRKVGSFIFQHLTFPSVVSASDKLLSLQHLFVVLMVAYDWKDSAAEERR